MELFYREYGEGSPLIILHGLFGFSDNWVTFARALSDRYRVFVVDQRNHGNSPQSGEWNYGVMAEDLKEFIERHGLQGAVVLGHSMGGKTVMEFAAHYPELISKMIVVDMAPKAYEPRHDEIVAALRSVDLASIQKRSDAEAALAVGIPDPGVRQFLMKNLARNPQKGFRWKMNLPVIAEKIENVVEAVAQGAHSMVPALFVRGANSNYVTDADIPAIEDIFADSEVVTVEGAGHWVHAEKPAELLEAVEEFLEA
ncbi:alpha/beta hydrolase [Fulvitalea axinellae]|uniref:Alpha/beta hydrolase n=1 Tax=Fulvitalea axinellae TaxID=1182444 RepID=A0AAU9D7F3_9BACT|nr:alpha/beta hydrolase [Fulvitalea axinellae]